MERAAAEMEMERRLRDIGARFSSLPDGDELLRLLEDVLKLIVEAFRELDDVDCSSYGTRVSMLETFAEIRGCNLLLDLDCNDLIQDMFHYFFRTTSYATSFFAFLCHIFTTLSVSILLGSVKWITVIFSCVLDFEKCL
ncbi:hypothetical protein E2562_038714 [Oryza meyeriana var. granulata]|uniref:Rx N-terminal domain-containing protein n=1 Tax=Oryza meyeriana var. granulata TaxID=110450 RepID=A0A6G1C165_9ORYZ|nr:hypothetical protein E2562_038714 [Oryza meyeriana var. granulata]